MQLILKTIFLSQKEDAIKASCLNLKGDSIQVSLDLWLLKIVIASFCLFFSQQFALSISFTRRKIEQDWVCSF